MPGPIPMPMPMPMPMPGPISIPIPGVGCCCGIPPPWNIVPGAPRPSSLRGPGPPPPPGVDAPARRRERGSAGARRRGCTRGPREGGGVRVPRAAPAPPFARQPRLLGEFFVSNSVLTCNDSTRLGEGAQPAAGGGERRTSTGICGPSGVHRQRQKCSMEGAEEAGGDQRQVRHLQHAVEAGEEEMGQIYISGGKRRPEDDVGIEYLLRPAGPNGDIHTSGGISRQE